MKKYLFVLTAAVFGMGANLSADPIHLNNEFQVNERFFALTSTFDLQSQSQIFGTISKEFFTLNSVYNFTDPFGQQIARAESQFFTWGTTADIYAATNEKIGWIEEQLFTWFSPSKYRVYDGSNRMVAVARMNFWGTTFTVTDPNDNNKEIALIFRPWFQFFTNSWTVQILDPQKISMGQIDPRLLVMVAVYRTDSENRAAFYRRSQKALDWYLDQNNRNGIGLLGGSQDPEMLALEARIQAFDAELGDYAFPEPDSNAAACALLDQAEGRIQGFAKQTLNVPDSRDAGRQVSGEQFYAARAKMEAEACVEILEECSKNIHSSISSDAEKGEMVYFMKQLIRSRTR